MIIESGNTVTTRTSNEHGIAGKDSTIVAIFEEIADTVLCVAGSMEGFDFNALADGESIAVAWGLGDFVAVFAADDRDLIGFELVNVYERRK